MTGTWEAEGWERCRWEGRDFAAEASDCRHGSGRSHTAWVLVVTREHGPGESGMNSEVGCKGNGVLRAGADGQWPCCKELITDWVFGGGPGGGGGRGGKGWWPVSRAWKPEQTWVEVCDFGPCCET